MPHKLIDGMIHTVVMLLAAHLVFYSSYPVMGADTHSGCYRTSSVEISPRTCDSDSKNCKVPLTVSADHKPGMSLCFQGIDATYEVYPVNATNPGTKIVTDRICRPLRPSQSVTSINDPCFEDLIQPAKDAISASGIKQQGVYKMSSTDIKNGNICSAPPLGDEQSCPNGLHTLMGTCASTENCPKVVEVVSYYCPEVKSYTVYQIQYNDFIYNLEVNKTDLSNTASGITSYILPTESSDDQPLPYAGWSIIDNTTDGGHSYARQRGVPSGDCTDYCAMVQTDNIFHTNKHCFTTSANPCNTKPQVTWQEFNPSREEDLVPLPLISKEDGSLLEEDGTYTTPHIVNPFTYTADIGLQSTRADPKVTAICDSNRTAPAIDAGIEKRTYPELDLMYVRRVCDQVVLSLYDCVLRYSHHDGSSMYWTVENTGNESECKIHVIDDTTVYDLNLAVQPMDEREHDSISTATTKRPPAWVIAIIVATGVVAALIICIVIILCLRARSRRAKKELRQREAITNPLHADILDDVEMNVYASSHTAPHDNGPAGNHHVLPANITANYTHTQTQLPDDEIHRSEAMNLPPRPVTPHTTPVLMEPIEEELMVIVVDYQEPQPEAPEIVVHENEPFYAAVPVVETQQLPTASCISQPHQHLSRDAGRALQTDFGPRVYPFPPTSPFSFHTDQHSIHTHQQSSLIEQQSIMTDQQAIPTDEQAIPAGPQAILIEQQRDQTRPTVETSLNPELTVCPIGQRFDDEDHDSPDVTQTQREVPDDEIHGSEAMYLPPRPVTPCTPAMHVDPSQEELTVIGAENNKPEPESELPVMDIAVLNEPDPLHASVPVVEAQPQQPPAAAAVLQRVSRRPDPLAHLSREQRRELLYLQTDFGPRVHPSPEISPRNSPRTAILRKRVKRWRYIGAAGGTAETIVEEPHTTESPPAVSVASSESDEQSVLTEEQPIAGDQLSMATDQQSTHTEQQGMHAAEQQAALPVVRPAYQGELPEDSMETMYPSSRWFTEPEIGDELLPPAPADPPVRPAWLLREHVSAFLYLVVHIAFEIHSESEKDGVLREMKNNWSQLDTIVLGRIPGAVPLVPMTEDRRESVIPAEWETELVRATVQSADFCMHHEQREESNEAAINASVQAGTERVLHYIRTYGGNLVSCILFVKLNTEGE